jgi:hypothetical protein
MTSEIKVDTISEQTSANGVTIDGLTIKDGNIQGSPALVGTTPSFTIGDGGAEDTKIVFDGNALDYYIGLDDSADNLIIGSGSTVGSNSLITIDSDGDFTLDSAADITLDVGGGDISLKGSGAEYGKFNLSGNSLNIHSSISDGDIVFKGSDGGSTITALTLDMSDAGKAIFNSSITSGSFVEANGNISTASNSGKLRAGASNELELSHNGSHGEIDVDTGNLTLDVVGDIILDADGADVSFRDDGTGHLSISNSSNDAVITSLQSDKDMIFKGVDGGSLITALTLDMSSSGQALFNSSVFVGNHLYLVDSKKAIFGAGEDLNIQSDGTNGQINAVNGTLILDVAGDITLDAGGGDIILSDDTTIVGTLSVNSSDLKIRSRVSDKDLIFQGNDGGSEITALTLDMSDAGTATFNHDIKLGNDQIAKFGAAANLQIYANSINSFITESGSSGNLKIQGQTIRLEKTTEEIMLRAVNDGQVELYYDNVIKILTSSTGINLPVDGDSIKFGANSEVVLTHVHDSGLKITHDGGGDPDLILANTASASDGNQLGSVFFNGQNSNGDEHTYAFMLAQARDVTDGEEDGQLVFYGNKGGSDKQFITYGANANGASPTHEVCINEGSEDIDFRVESNGNANMLFVDGGNDHVNIGTSSDLGGVLNVSGTGVFQTADNSNTITLISTDADASAGPRLSFQRQSSSPADSDILGQMYFTGKDSAGNNTDYATIKVATGDVTDGTEDGQIEFDVMTAGTAREYLRLASGSEPSVVINEDSQDIDFRVESNGNANCLFVDAGENRVGVGTNSPADTMHIKSTGDPSGDIRLILETNSTDGNCALDFRNSASTFRGGILYDTDDNNLQFKVNTTEHFRIAANGDLTATDTSIGSNSDSRLKENIADYTYDISKFKQFKAKTFDWKNPTQHNNGTGNRGFIAQEVAAIDDYWTDQISIDPDTEDAKLIDADSDGNHMAKTLKLGKKDAMYISVIQQLITRIEALEG